MKVALWKRALLAGLLTLSVAGGTVAPMVARNAAACSPGDERVRVNGQWWCIEK